MRAGTRPRTSTGRQPLARPVEVPLETDGEVADLLRVAQVRHGVGNGALVSGLQQRRELVASSSPTPILDVVVEDEVDEQANQPEASTAGRSRQAAWPPGRLAAWPRSSK